MARRILLVVTLVFVVVLGGLAIYNFVIRGISIVGVLALIITGLFLVGIVGALVERGQRGERL